MSRLEARDRDWLTRLMTPPSPALNESALPPLAAQESTAQVLVIGAGIIGLATALRLLQEGHQVTVIDRSGVAAEASRGNAGAFAFSDVLPLASPGILRQAPKWLLDPLGPLSLRPSYLPRIAPWLWRFWRASQPSQVAASTTAQAALLRLSAQETPAMLAAAGASALLREDGALHLYESEAEWQASAAGWALRQEHGIAFEHLHGQAALARLQPGLSELLVAGTFVPGWKTIADPLQLCLHLAQAVQAAGGRLRQAQALSLRAGPRAVSVQLQGGGSVQAQQLVLCGGAWSHQLAASLGDKIPLETERGYNTTLPEPGFELRRQLTFGGHGFVVTPLSCGIRVGGAVELGGLRAAPNFARADALLAKAQAFMPGLNAQGGKQWMGFRPSLPDSLPAIGYAPADQRVIYAFGHGHLGLTQSAATAKLVAELVAGRSTSLDLKPLRPGRFSGR